MKRIEEKVDVIHFTINTTRHSSWEVKNNMIQTAMDKIEEIKKEYSGNCTLEIFIMY